MRTALLALVTLLQFVFVSPSRATTANDVCARGADPCVVPVVKGGFSVTSGSTLDFGTRTLRVPAGAHTVVPGTVEGRLLGGNLALVAASIGTPTFVRPDIRTSARRISCSSASTA